MRFKIGDRVKVIGNKKSTAGKILYGRIGIVTHAFNSCLNLDLEKEIKDQIGGGLWNDEVQLISRDYVSSKPRNKPNV